MRSLSNSELVAVWEWGQNKPSLQQALIILSAAYPDMTLQDMTGLTVGDRDKMLLRLREGIFGPRVLGLASCPNCGEKLELSFEAANVPERDLNKSQRVESLTIEEFTVSFRLPTILDLMQSTAHDVPTMRRELLNCCISRAEKSGMEFEADLLPEAVLEAVVEWMEEADPHGDLQIGVSCPMCHQENQLPFDIVSFFWIEIDAWARRLLGEVHLLARAYGWSEGDILAMSSMRRQIYLNLVA
jgi:uncharacterized protein (UPF0212 family)